MRTEGRILFFAQDIKQLFGSTHDAKGERMMMDLFDVDAVEAAEASIDQFIERRSRERADANKEEEYWLEPVLRHRERRRERNRLLWHAYHLDRAECLERTAAELAVSHRSKAAALADGGEGVGS